MDVPQDIAVEPPAETDRLGVARRVEATISLARELRSRLKTGDWPRLRRRTRRQLRKLAHALEAIERAVLAGQDPVDAAALMVGLDDLDAMMRNALFHAPTRSELQELRRALKARRKALGG